MKQQIFHLAATILFLLGHSAAQTFAKPPMSFEPAQESGGQTSFQARAAGYAVSISSTVARIALAGLSSQPKLREQAVSSSQKAQHSAETRTPVILSMTLVAANPAAKITGVDELEAKSNYFLGGDPARWRTGISRYQKVRCQSVYPGIDLVYYGSQNQLEFDVIVAPGAHPEAVKLKFQGIDKLRIDQDGNLVLRATDREVVLHAPATYQDWNGQKQVVAARYALTDASEVALHLGDYDNQRALVIDPVLSYSTYLGGSDYDWGLDITTDNVGNTYVTGQTLSLDFPLAANPQQSVNHGNYDVFVSKFGPSGTLLLSTYIGGSAEDDGLGIVTDPSQSIYLTGQTQSTDFPVKNALQSTAGGGADAFVTKLDRFGRLVYSTYLGGYSDDIGLAIAVDPSGNAYVTGQTMSTNFPVKHALQPTNAGGSDAFVTKLNPSGTVLEYSTYLGGSGNDDEAYGIAIDEFRNAYVVGFTNSGNFPLKHALQPYPGGGYDAFVTKLNSSGSSLLYSTYLGGSNDENGLHIAVDRLGNAYVGGSTCSNDFPIVNAAQPQFGGICDAFVTKLNSAGSALVYSTYLGGSDFEFARGLAIQDVPSGVSAYVAGLTCSTDFPVVNAIQPTPGGICDAFVTRLSASGASLSYSTYLGGSDFEMSHGIAVDVQGNAYVAGGTFSIDFPTTKAFQSRPGGNADVFVTKIGLK